MFSPLILNCFSAQMCGTARIKKWGPSMQASILCSRLVFLRQGRKVAALSSESMHLTGPTPKDSARYRLGSDDCFSFKYEMEEPSVIINNVVPN